MHDGQRRGTGHSSQPRATRYMRSAQISSCEDRPERTNGCIDVCWACSDLCSLQSHGRLMVNRPTSSASPVRPRTLRRLGAAPRPPRPHASWSEPFWATPRTETTLALPTEVDVSGYYWRTISHVRCRTQVAKFTRIPCEALHLPSFLLHIKSQEHRRWADRSPAVGQESNEIGRAHV